MREMESIIINIESTLKNEGFKKISKIEYYDGNIQCLLNDFQLRIRGGYVIIVKFINEGIINLNINKVNNRKRLDEIKSIVMNIEEVKTLSDFLELRNEMIKKYDNLKVTDAEILKPYTDNAMKTRFGYAIE